MKDCYHSKCLSITIRRIRDRSKNLKEMFFEIGKRVWNIYHSENASTMGQRLRRLREWAGKRLSGVMKDNVLDLCAKGKQWRLMFKYPTGHKTSHALDRLMRAQNQYFDEDNIFTEPSRLPINTLVHGRSCTITGTDRHLTRLKIYIPPK